MKISTFLRLAWRTITEPDKQRLVQIASIHEAGHIMMCYFVGWAADSVEIEFVDDQFHSAVTRYRIGDDARYIELLSNNVRAFNQLPLNEKIQCFKAGEKRMFALMGGPIAEHLFRAERKGSISIDFTDNRIPDTQVINYFDSTLRRLSPDHPANFLDENLQLVTAILNDNTNFKTALSLANLISGSEDYRLNNDEIEGILQDLGYLTYVHNLLNR